MPVVKKQSPKKKTVKKARPSSKSLLSQASGIDFGDEGLKVALYGRSGTGKTTLWASFPKPILAIICSGGRAGELRSVANVKGIKKLELVESEEIFQIADELEDASYKTVVLDHATHLQDLTLKEVLGLDEVPTQKSWGLATQQQYGQVAIKMKEYLRALLDLQSNIVIVAQEREFGTDNDTDLIMPTVGAALTPSVTGWLNPACDYICQTFIRGKTLEKKVKIGGKTTTKLVRTSGVDYCLRTGPDEVYTTKFRVPKGHELPEVVVDPDYKKIMAIIEGQ